MLEERTLKRMRNALAKAIINVDATTREYLAEVINLIEHEITIVKDIDKDINSANNIDPMKLIMDNTQLARENHMLIEEHKRLMDIAERQNEQIKYLMSRENYG